MSVNVATFTVEIAVPGDQRTLVQAKRQIESILDEVRSIPGVTVRRGQQSMLICTAPGRRS